MSAVLYKLHDHIARITLNRPKVLNAFNNDMYKGLDNAVLKFREDKNAWVAVIAGAGDRSFSVGQDVNELGGMLGDLESIPNIWDSFYNQSIQYDLEQYKPVIAAISGYCIGEGLCVAMSCDFRICSESSQFSYPEVALGMPTIIGAIRAARLMGLGHALELLLMGEKMDADWAYRTGLANKVVPVDQLETASMAWAERLCKMGPIAVRCTKEVAVRSVNMSFPDAARMGEAMRRAAFQSRDTWEGLAAFAEKRDPRYQGR